MSLCYTVNSLIYDYRNIEVNENLHFVGCAGLDFYLSSCLVDAIDTS